jgi:predicted  nucleic acid-binding Zn-ribbon protein
MASLETLLTVQEHDTAIDHLRHRRATLPEREALTRAETVVRDLEAPAGEVRARHDTVTREVRRLEDEVATTAARVQEVEATLYSGSITSPRELQALQADVDQLRRHRSAVEDRELELLEQQEAIDGELGELAARLDAAQREIAHAREVIAAREAEIDAEIAAEATARAAAAEEIPAPLLADYDACRARAGGVGAARLTGHTCQGCRLTIPATEVARIRKAGADAPVEHCDNCGAILVPSR